MAVVDSISIICHFSYLNYFQLFHSNITMSKNNLALVAIYKERLGKFSGFAVKSIFWHGNARPK